MAFAFDCGRGGIPARCRGAPTPRARASSDRCQESGTFDVYSSRAWSSQIQNLIMRFWILSTLARAGYTARIPAKIATTFPGPGVACACAASLRWWWHQFATVRRSTTARSEIKEARSGGIVMVMRFEFMTPRAYHGERVAFKMFRLAVTRRNTARKKPPRRDSGAGLSPYYQLPNEVPGRDFKRYEHFATPARRMSRATRPRSNLFMQARARAFAFHG